MQKLRFVCLDEVRKDVQSEESEAHRKQFFMSRTLLKKRAEDLDDKSFQKPVRLFELYPPLEVAWDLKEEFRNVLQLSRLEEAVDALQSWYQGISSM